MKRGWKIAIITAALLVVLLLLVLGAVAAGLFGHLPGRDELTSYRNSSASLVLAAGGEPIGRIFAENRTAITYEQLPNHLVSALVAIEDVRFFDHTGVDSRSLFRVIFKTLLFNDRSAGGGSTITQQLAKNMYGRRDYALFPVFLNKTREMILAGRIEKVFTKQDIILLYLNTVSFGENIFGIEAASQRYFSKKTTDLTVEEAALLTGMLKANTLYNPRLYPDKAVSRRNVVLRQMEKYGYLGSSAADSLTALPMRLNYSKSDLNGPADYFLVRVRSEADRIMQEVAGSRGKVWDIERDGLVITTTLILPLQQAVNGAFATHLPRMQRRLDEQYGTAWGRRELSQVPDSLRRAATTLHAGLLALDPVTGAVLAWAGGIDFRRQPYDQVMARRQLASVFKPFIYAAALEEGIEPCHYLDNDSVVLTDFRDWSPENYNHNYGGKYSLTGALSLSMNVPTFNLFMQTGFDRVSRLWHDMGFSFPLVNSPALALGTAEASILEVALAYGSFANGGIRTTPYLIETIETSGGRVLWQHQSQHEGSRIITERTAQLIGAMLEKAVREGTGASVRSAYGVTIPLAGKTGTSQNYGDAWFAAYNPRMVMVSRVGASTPSVHFTSGAYGSGSALALPLVGLTLRSAERNRELMKLINNPFPPLPPELEKALDCPDFREETFMERLIDIFRSRENEYSREPQRRSIFRRPKRTR